MARTQSRYERGLSYEPGMQGSRYAPTRAAAELGGGGNYGGVTPIPGGGAGEVGVSPQLEGGGNGLGSGGNMLAGLALTALSNPRVTNWLTDQVRGTSGGIPTIQPDSGVQLAPGLPYNIGPRPTEGLPISDLPTAAIDEASFLPAPDGGASVGDGFGAMDGGLEGGAGGSGGWMSGLQGMAYDPNLTGLDGVLGSGLMGGGFDWMSGAATLGAGALGNWVSGQAGYEGRRDPLGRQIGSGLGSAVGGLFLGPVGAFLGAQFGGAIGGQFGPMATVGPNWSTMNTWQPTAASEWFNLANSENPMTPGQQFTLDGQWGSHSGADNGGRVNAEASQAFQNALLGMAQQQGYGLNPGNAGGGYTFGYYGGGPNAPGEGYFYQGGNGGQQFYGTDLSAAALGWGGAPTGQSYGDTMLNFAFNDLVNQGVFAPMASLPTAQDAQQAMWNSANAGNQRGADFRSLNNVGAPGN